MVEPSHVTTLSLQSCGDVFDAPQRRASASFREAEAADKDNTTDTGASNTRKAGATAKLATAFPAMLLANAPTKQMLSRRFTWQLSKREHAKFAEHASRRPEARWRAFGSELKVRAAMAASQFLASEVQALCLAYKPLVSEEDVPSADIENNEMYTPVNILRREMLKTNSRVMAVLDR
jgi:hypothetical protein